MVQGKEGPAYTVYQRNWAAGMARHWAEVSAQLDEKYRAAEQAHNARG